MNKLYIIFISLFLVLGLTASNVYAIDKPNPPRLSNLTSTSVQVSWDRVPNSDHYVYEIKVASSTQASPVGDITSFNLHPLEPATDYQIVIRACPNPDDCADSAQSDPTSFTTPAAGGGSTGGSSGGSGGTSGGAGTDDLIGGVKSLLGTDNQGHGDSQIKKFGNLGGLVSGLLGVVFSLAGILMFIWALAGIFQYITSGGNKEGLAKARARITWAIVGFLFIVISFSLSKYISEIIQPVCTATVSASCQQSGLKCVNSGGKPVCQ